MDCKKCIYVGSVPKSIHCSCKHPAVDELISFSEDLFNHLKRLTDTKEDYEYGELRIIRLGMSFSLAVAEQGIEGKWFIFPFNFDPRWIETCTGFKERDF